MASTWRKLLLEDDEVTVSKLTIGSAEVTEEALEILDGATVTTAELNILDGVTADKNELNLLDGITTLSGSNTGDQTLPTDFVSKASGGTFGGNVTITGDLAVTGTQSFSSITVDNTSGSGVFKAISEDDNYLEFTANTDEHAYIKASDDSKIYIGHASGAKLTIDDHSSNGNATFAGTINSGAITSTAGISGTTGIFTGNITLAGGSILSPSGHINIVPTSGKNVGIDCTPTLGTLQINGSLYVATSAVFVSDVTTDGVFKVNSAPDSDVIVFDQSGRKEAIKTTFSATAGLSEMVFKTSTGNVNGSMDDSLKITRDKATFTGDIYLADGKGFYGFLSRLFMWTDTSGTFIKSVDNDATNGIHFQNYAGTEIVTFLDGGYVGINTSSPGATLPPSFTDGKGLLEIRSDGTGTDPGLLLRRSDDVTGLDIWHDSSGGGTYGSYFDNRYEDSHWWWRSGTRSGGFTIPFELTNDGNGIFAGDLTVTGGDIHSNGKHIISNSASATTLIIGDAAASDAVQEVAIKAYGNTVLLLGDGESVFSGTIEATSGTFSGTVEVANDIIIDHPSGNADCWFDTNGTRRLGISATNSGPSYISTMQSNGSIVLRTGATADALTLDSSQNATFTGNATFNDNVFITDGDGLVIGNNAQRDQVHSISGNSASNSTPELQVEGTGISDSHISIIRNSDDAEGAQLTLGSTRNASPGGKTVVTTGDRLGTITFSGNDGNEMVMGAAIWAKANGSFGDIDMPTDLYIGTTKDGQYLPTVALTIDSTQNATFSGKLTVSAGANQAAMFQSNSGQKQVVIQSPAWSGNTTNNTISALEITNSESTPEVIFNITGSGNATFAGDVTLSNNKKIIYGNAGENIYGNGTHLYVVSSDDLNLTAGGNSTIDVVGDINLDSDGGNTYFRDAGTIYGACSNTSGNLIIKSGTTTMLTASGADILFAGHTEIASGKYYFIGGWSRVSDGGSLGNIAFNQYNGSSWNDTLNITNAGNATFAGKIALGGGSPNTTNQLMHIKGAAGTDKYAALIENTSSDGFGVYIHAASGTRSALHIRDYSVGTDLFSVKGNGNATFAGDVSVGGDFSVTGSQTFGATTFNGHVRTQTTNQAFIARYNNGDTFASVLGWSSAVGGVLQLGNNGLNEIRGGHSSANGYLRFVVNNTASWSDAHNGTAILTLSANGAATFSGDVTVSGGDIHSNGKHIISNSASAAELIIGDAAASDAIHEIKLSVWAGNDIIITDDGVGIGNTAPCAPLHIKADPANTTQPQGANNAPLADSHTALFINGTGGALEEKIGLQFGHWSNHSIGGIFGIAKDSNHETSGNITFDMRKATNDTYLTEVMTITNSGNVGIGTASPAYTGLHIHNSSNQLGITNDATGATSTDGFGIAVIANQSVQILQKEDAPMDFYTDDAFRMRIDENSNV